MIVKSCTLIGQGAMAAAKTEIPVPLQSENTTIQGTVAQEPSKNLPSEVRVYLSPCFHIPMCVCALLHFCMCLPFQVFGDNICTAWQNVLFPACHRSAVLAADDGVVGRCSKLWTQTNQGAFLSKNFRQHSRRSFRRCSQSRFLTKWTVSLPP